MTCYVDFKKIGPSCVIFMLREFNVSARLFPLRLGGYYIAEISAYIFSAEVRCSSLS